MTLDLSREYDELFQMKFFGGKEVREDTYMLTFNSKPNVSDLFANTLRVNFLMIVMIVAP
jgi:hypothetical protein